MPRRERIVLVNIAHHITQRGNNREQVFFTDSDYRAYLALLAQYAHEAQLDVLGYCLMPNHLHQVAIPRVESAFARGIGLADQCYTRRINARLQRSGHLWQNRFFSCPMDETYLWRALRYVELNPVRAGLVTTPWEYPWSSAAAHIGHDDTSGLLDLRAWEKQWNYQDWRQFLGEPIDPDEVEMIRNATLTGRPLGTTEFLKQLAQSGVNLPRQAGRPRQ